jgi:fructose-bisphosphate aldolase class II
MISWGVKVNDYGNAQLDEKGEFIRSSGVGVTDATWDEMVGYAREKGWKKGDYKKLNLPFENRLLGQSREIRDRMAKAVEDFVFALLTGVFNAADTAPLAVEAILDAGSHDLGAKARRMEDPAQWDPERIRLKAAALDSDKGRKGDFED